MSELSSSDPSPWILRPSRAEIRHTRVLFYSRHASDLTPARAQRFGYSVVYHASIVAALRELGLTVAVGSDPELLFTEIDADYLWFTLIRAPFDGHELLIPSIAAYRGLAFLGPAAPVRALSEDKALGKALAASLGLEVAPHRMIDPLSPAAADLALSGRWVLKPRTGVMSEALAVLGCAADWAPALKEAALPVHGGREFIAEELVPGLNLAVPVVEGLPPLSVFEERGVGADNILTEAGKEGRTADYGSRPYAGPGAAEAAAAAAALAAAIAPFDYARFDFRYDPQGGRLVFLEVNMNCALGPAGVVARAAALQGIDHRTLVGHIFTHSLRRQRSPL
ncbi:MAG: hypothetical protein JO127_09965 [Caulobacteraceae bacterium]|nr:hypothetical protein [Caulobacteraceae bacterium]